MHRLRALKAACVAALARALYLTGILHLLVYAGLRRRAIVLMYHRVIAPEDRNATFSHPGIVVESATFERHLRLLRRHFRVLSVDAFAERLRSGESFPSRSCLITFDDGWSDNYERAYPLLKRYGLPAVIFLPSGYIGTDRRFWQETLVHALCRAAGAPHDPAMRGLLERAGLGEPLPAERAAAKALIQAKVGQLKEGGAAARKDLLDDARAIASAAPSPAPHVDTFMSWEQVREMMAGGVRFGSHSVNHALLTELAAEQVREEAARSKLEIERELGTDVIAFSYPNGDHDADVCRIVAKCGYELAFTTTPGTVRAGDDPHRIRRINVHEGSCSSAPLLLARIAGVL